MSTVLYVGMDVHSTSYSLATFALGEREARFELKIEPDYEQVLQYLGTVRRQLADTLGEVEFVCGYEAGCLGDTLYHQLTAKGIKCVIVASTTILEPRSLAFGTYRAVHVLTDEDKSVKDFIRMRDDHQKKLKQVKLELLAFCLRHCHRFTETRRYWTHRHMAWLKGLALGALLQETLAEYLVTYENLKDRVERLDRRIAELSQDARYIVNVIIFLF